MNQKDSKTIEQFFLIEIYLAKQVPYGAQILFVEKKDDKLKMCIDYHALNKISIKKQVSFASH